MIDLPADIFDRLRANADATRAAQIEGRREPDHHPALKLFNQCADRCTSSSVEAPVETSNAAPVFAARRSSGSVRPTKQPRSRLSCYPTPPATSPPRNSRSTAACWARL